MFFFAKSFNIRLKQLPNLVDVSFRRAWCAQQYTDSRRLASALCPAQVIKNS